MDPDRFACYIQGGTPHGGKRNYEGCDDKELPRNTACVWLPYQQYFAGHSPVWNGGAAFLNLKKGGGKTKGKAYLITNEQFEQVVAKESHRDYVVPLDLRLIRKLGWIDVGEGRYDRILYCGDYKGHPLLTCTSPEEIRPYTRPSPAYLKMIASGLHGAYGMPVEEIVVYLLDKPGVKAHYDAPELHLIVEEALVRKSAQHL